MEDLDFSKIKQSPLSVAERKNIVTALNQGVHHKAIWINCINNHKILIGNCGLLYKNTIICTICKDEINERNQIRADEYNSLRAYNCN